MLARHNREGAQSHLRTGHRGYAWRGYGAEAEVSAVFGGRAGGESRATLSFVTSAELLPTHLGFLAHNCPQNDYNSAVLPHRVQILLWL